MPPDTKPPPKGDILLLRLTLEGDARINAALYMGDRRSQGERDGPGAVEYGEGIPLCDPSIPETEACRDDSPGPGSGRPRRLQRDPRDSGTEIPRFYTGNPVPKTSMEKGK